MISHYQALHPDKGNALVNNIFISMSPHLTVMFFWAVNVESFCGVNVVDEDIEFSILLNDQGYLIMINDYNLFSGKSQKKVHILISQQALKSIS